MGLLTQPGNYPLLRNTRAYIPGRLETRYGIIKVNSNALGGLTHSLKRLNDPLPGATNSYAILAGASTKLWLGQVNLAPSAFALIDNGYSSNPLGFVTYRPPNSPESWLYVSDSAQMRKVRSDGLVFPQGIAPPLTAPTVDFAEPLLTIMDDFNESMVGGWTTGGTAGALSANPAARISDTVRAPFNEGPGWVEYLEADNTFLKAGYGRGMLLVLDTTPALQEVVILSSIFPSKLNTTIQAIAYDSGVNGPCCIVPSSPSTLVNNLTLRGLLSKLARTWFNPFTAGGNLQIQPNAILMLGSTPAPTDVLVLSSTPGPLGTFSVRTSTVGTDFAGETLDAVSSFRAYDANAHTNPVTTAAGYFRSTVAAGTGTISDTALTVDLSIIGTRPTQPTDEIHLSVRLDVPDNLTEGRIIFDVDSANHDFAHNYYYASFRASDLTPAVSGTTTTQQAIQTSITTAQIDSYNAENRGGYYQQLFNGQSPTDPTTLPAASTQAGTGTAQWTELFIPISSLIRVGTDSSRTLANVMGVRIQFTVTNSTVCDIHGLYLKGSYGPDVGTVGSDYYYRYRRRSTMTGAKSNPSPYNRSGIRPHAQRIAVTMPGDNTEGDQLDVFRWGGSVVTETNGVIPWFYVGSAPNPGAGNTTVFNDDFADSDILNAEILEFDNYQPYPTIDIPRSGTCMVVGTSVQWVSGDKFNTNWAPGSIIEINGVPYTLYAQPETDEFCEIVESATSLGVTSKITQVIRPSSFIQLPGSVVAIQNPGFAYDGNPVTAATADVPQGPNNPTAAGKWIIDVPPIFGAFDSAVLSVLAYFETDTVPANSGNGIVEYTFDASPFPTVMFLGPNLGTSSSPVLLQSSPSLGGVSQINVIIEDGVNNAAMSGIGHMAIHEIYLTVTYSPSVVEPVPFILRKPTILAQPMYGQWGPFLGYLLAVGDPYQPGVMHCTKPNQPDEASDLLDVEITSPSEPMMNGCMFGNGYSFAWSTQRMFQLHSSSDLGLQFTATGSVSTSAPFVPQEVPGSPGLFAKWWFCVGDKMYYGTSTGIVATTGGTPVSITDQALSLLFPHDGQNGVPVQIGSATFYPPDMTQPDSLRLFYEKNHVKFTYLDTQGTRRVIVYSVIYQVWSTDEYVTVDSDPQILSCYSEEGESINRNLLGGLDYVYREAGDLEAGNNAGTQIKMAQISDFPGFLHVRESYIGLMSVTPSVLDVIADTTTYTQTIPGTGGAYDKVYVPLGPAKGKYFEWSFTNPGSVRLFLKDCFSKMKPWGGESYQQIEIFRDLNRELKP